MFSGDSPLAGFADEWAGPGKNLRTKSAIARRSWLRRRFVSLRTGTASTGQEFSGHRTTDGKDPQLCAQSRQLGECASAADRKLLRSALSAACWISGNVLSSVSRSVAKTPASSAPNSNARFLEVRSYSACERWTHLHRHRSL